MDRISEHISYSEATRSGKAKKLGLDNNPSKEILSLMKITAKAVFEPVRVFFNLPIYVSSFYRAPLVNLACKGSKTSDHPKGLSIDMDADYFNNGLTNAMIFWFIYQFLEFDQLIWEYGDNDQPSWVHVSYREGANRKQVLKTVVVGGKKKTIPFKVKDHLKIKFKKK